MTDEKEKARRLACVGIHPQTIANFFKPGMVFKVVSGLPGDAVFLSAQLGDFGHSIECLFKSESFEHVEVGMPIPRLSGVEMQAYAAGPKLTFKDEAYLCELADMVDNAQRKTAFPVQGLDEAVAPDMVDEPEGSIKIEMSDTLAKEISKRLREILQQDA